MYRPMREIYVFKKDSIFIYFCNKSNSCILLNNSNYIQCHYFIKDKENNVKVVGNVLKVLDNFYQNHFKDASEKLHITIVRETKKMQSTFYPIESCVAKVCKFPLEAKNRFVVIPLIHTCVQ